MSKNFPLSGLNWRNLGHPPTAAALTVALGIPLAIYKLDKATSHDWSLSTPFWIFAAQTVLAFALLFHNRKNLGQFLSSLNPGKVWFGLLAVLALGTAALDVSLVEARHRVQSDESIFLTTAQNMRYNQVAGSCDEGYFDAGKLECMATASNFKAKGLAWLVMLGIPVLSNDVHWVFPAHVLLYVLSWLAMAAAVFAWTRSRFLAIVATAFLMVQPTVMFQFRSFSVEPLYVFLSAMALLAFKWAQEKDHWSHWAFLALVLAFFAQTRQETLFCLPAFALAAAPRLLDRRDHRAAAFLIPLSFFLAPVLLTISNFQGYGFQGGETNAHGNFFSNLGVFWNVMAATPMKNGLLGNPFLTWFTWVSLLGLIFLAASSFLNQERRRWAIFLVLYHLQSYMILENVSGDLTIEINQRYTLVMLPTMAFLAAIFFRDAVFSGLPAFLGMKPEKFQSAKAELFAAIALAVLATALTARHAESFRANIMYNRNHLTTEEHGIHQWLDKQARGKLFVYARPWHFTAYGWSAIHYNRFRGLSEGEQKALVDKFAGEVYYVRGLDCWDAETWHKKAVESRISATCDQFENVFELESKHQFMVTDNYVVNIARIIGPKGYDQSTLVIPGIFHILPEQGYSLLSYAMGSSSVPMQSLRIFINDSLFSEQPFVTGQAIDTLRSFQARPGINTVRFEALGQSGKILASRETSAFANIGGAEPLWKLRPVRAGQSWGEVRRDLTVDGHGFRVAGRNFDQGIGVHAFSRIEYNLTKPMTRLTALAGVDDEQMGGDGVSFRVVGDGKVLYESGPTRNGQIKTVTADLIGIRTLVLEVDSLGNKDYDHADWIYPTLIP